MIDEYMLLIHPLVLGSGPRLFAEVGTHSAMRFVAVEASPSGVVIATYQPVG